MSVSKVTVDIKNLNYYAVKVWIDSNIQNIELSSIKLCVFFLNKNTGI